MTDASSIASAFHPGIAKLRQQLAGLLPDAAPAVTAAAETTRPALLRQAVDNLPLLMEAGTTLLRWMRGAPANVARLAPAPALAPSLQRRLVRPVVIAVAVFGAAYLVSVALRPGPSGTRRA